jgi:hypothetical protein
MGEKGEMGTLARVAIQLPEKFAKVHLHGIPMMAI